MFIERRLKGWPKVRNWEIKVEENPKFSFIIWAEDDSHREVAITRDKHDKGVLSFAARMHIDKEWEPKLTKLTAGQRTRLIEDIHVFFAAKDVGYAGASWPLDKLAVQGALPLDQQLSEHLVDLKAKEIINAVIGVRSLIRKAIAQL